MVVALSLLLTVAPGSPVAKAIESYERGDYLAATALLERALGSGIADDTERAEARLHLAASYFAIGDRASAERVLTVLLQEAPLHVVDATLFPPPFLQTVERVRTATRVAAPPPVPKTIEAAPAALVDASTTHALRRWWWLPASIGLVGAGVGAGLLVKAESDHRRLVTPPMSPADVLNAAQAAPLAQGGALAQTVGWSALVVGAAGLVATFIVYFAG